GGGAYLLEVWGQTALEYGRLDEAEEGFLEALAHDGYSGLAALGLKIICERMNRSDEAARYGELAKKCWKDADPGTMEAETSYLASLKLPASPTAQTAPAAATAAMDVAAPTSSK